MVKNNITVQESVIKKFISLAKNKKSVDNARALFLEEMRRNYNMLLLKCYLSHMTAKSDSLVGSERIAILGSSNILGLKDMLKALFHAENIESLYYSGEYGNYLQELISPSSGLYAFKPSVTLVVLGVEDILSGIFENPFSYTPQKINEAILRLTDSIRAGIEAHLAVAPEANIYLALMPSCDNPANYIYSPSAAYRTDFYFNKIYETMAALEEKNENIFLLDTKRLMRRCPANKVEDSRWWYLGRIRYSDIFLFEIAKEVLDIYTMAGRPCKKCLVLDLDNTLWGGIVGQDGLENIVLGQDGLGRAFQDFQREILKLHDKGIMLAVCSKNNLADAQEVFRKHSGMVLKEEHFAAWRVNWADKASNIKEIAGQINIGLDSIVFFDDDAAERKWVEENLPQVTVPQLPEDQFIYADFLKKSNWFNSYRLTQEDIIRNVSYKAISRAKGLERSSKDIWSYLKSLNQQVVLEKVDSSTLSRAAQLSQKTNQFNLTTTRYQILDLKAFIKDKYSHPYVIRVKDCFCDYGIVGLLILKDAPKEKGVYIDTFLLSCRVIGRKIEFVLLDWLKSAFKKKKYDFIEGFYLRTEKNTVCESTYKDNGFTPVSIDKKSAVFRYGLKKRLKLSSFNRYIKLKAC